MNGLYTTKPFRVSPHLLFCQRLLGVRPKEYENLGDGVDPLYDAPRWSRADQADRCQDSIQ